MHGHVSLFHHHWSIWKHVSVTAVTLVFVVCFEVTTKKSFYMTTLSIMYILVRLSKAST